MNYKTNFDLSPFFREEQKFHPIFYIALILPSISVWILFILQIFFKKAVGKKPAPDYVIFILFLIIGVLLPYIIMKIKLITEIRGDGIYLKFVPFHFKYKYFSFSEINRAEYVTYSPVKEYGGWGIRYGKDGWAYNVKGNKGIRFYLKNEKKLLIGTQKGEEFINILNLYLK